MVELAESIPDHEEIQKGSVQYHYAFALNRRNKKGDRVKAVGILEKVSCDFMEFRVHLELSPVMH